MTFAVQVAGEAADAGLVVSLLRDGETAVIRLSARRPEPNSLDLRFQDAQRAADGQPAPSFEVR